MNATTVTQDRAATPGTAGEGLIDVRRLMAELSLEQLCRTADEYYARLDSWDFHHAKPFALIDDLPDVLIKLSAIIRGLKLLPGMSVIDFGAGTGWLSRYLTQMGLEVISLDVSKAALAIARDLYARQPVAGDQPPPRFVVFDGRRIDLPDGSVDRIVCFDAFHHVPNPAEVIGELCRVLKQGGIAGFSEPGPHHSKSPASQYEMKNYRVVENDVILEEIWADARRAGFTKLELAVNSYEPLVLSLEEHAEFLSGGGPTSRYVEAMRCVNHNMRIFFLQKGEPGPPDSRQRAGLGAQLEVRLDSSLVPASREGSPWRRPKPQLFTVHATIRNSGQSIWLPSNARVGAVNFGCHLYDPAGNLLQLGYVHAPLLPGAPRAIHPGETLSVDVEIPAPRRGEYLLEFDLVSEAVCWFGMHGHSQPVRKKIEAV